jgi:hypothetical protein
VHQHHNVTARFDTPSKLGARARLCLFLNTSVSTEHALALGDEDITSQFLRESGCTATGILTAGLGPMFLNSRGVRTARELRDFGFDALHLVDSALCNQAVLAYGAEDVKSAFVCCGTDAVALSGSDSMRILNLSVAEMLRVCAGFPCEAAAVLQQLPRGMALEGVPIELVLDSGLRCGGLTALGYHIPRIVEHCNAKAHDLVKLGYKL